MNRSSSCDTPTPRARWARAGRGALSAGRGTGPAQLRRLEQSGDRAVPDRAVGGGARRVPSQDRSRWCHRQRVRESAAPRLAVRNDRASHVCCAVRGVC